MFNPEDEKNRLYRALTRLLDTWGKSGMVEALADLCLVLARAKHALAVLDQQPDEGPAWRVHRAGLSILIAWAEAEVERAEHFALTAIGQRLTGTATPREAFDTVVPVGTIISCPDCGEGLYKVARCTTSDDIVCEDGGLLVPLNTTIPSPDVWKPLACSLCGGRLLRDGKIHTLQQGWV